MTEGDVITLEDNTQYILINETELDDKKYFSAMQIDENGQFDKDSLAFFEYVTENNEEYLEDVEDEKLKQILAIHNLEYYGSQEEENFTEKMEQFFKEQEQKGSN